MYSLVNPSLPPPACIKIPLRREILLGGARRRWSATPRAVCALEICSQWSATLLFFFFADGEVNFWTNRGGTLPGVRRCADGALIYRMVGGGMFFFPKSKERAFIVLRLICKIICSAATRIPGLHVISGKRSTFLSPKSNKFRQMFALRPTLTFHSSVNYDPSNFWMTQLCIRMFNSPSFTY